jgi:aerobic-type carbon monoxide dehydrogenase small subunit (CoxS/CutS family)
VVSAAALVAADESPTVEEIRHHMAGNICRCGTYPRIEEAILHWRD